MLVPSTISQLNALRACSSSSNTELHSRLRRCDACALPETRAAGSQSTAVTTLIFIMMRAHARNGGGDTLIRRSVSDTNAATSVNVIYTLIYTQFPHDRMHALLDSLCVCACVLFLCQERRMLLIVAKSSCALRIMNLRYTADVDTWCTSVWSRFRPGCRSAYMYHTHTRGEKYVHTVTHAHIP